jgi:hypothetical protein
MFGRCSVGSVLRLSLPPSHRLKSPRTSRPQVRRSPCRHRRTPRLPLRRLAPLDAARLPTNVVPPPPVRPRRHRCSRGPVEQARGWRPCRCFRQRLGPCCRATPLACPCGEPRHARTCGPRPWPDRRRPAPRSRPRPVDGVCPQAWVCAWGRFPTPRETTRVLATVPAGGAPLSAAAAVSSARPRGGWLCHHAPGRHPPARGGRPWPCGGWHRAAGRPGTRPRRATGAGAPCPRRAVARPRPPAPRGWRTSAAVAAGRVGGPQAGPRRSANASPPRRQRRRRSRAGPDPLRRAAWGSPGVQWGAGAKTASDPTLPGNPAAMIPGHYQNF